MIGVVTGCDHCQEWLLPWWYAHLRRHHPELPVAFGDLGMSKKAKKWCADRGILISASKFPLLSTSPRDASWLYQGRRWKCKRHLSLPDHISFRKPFILQQSPFDRTLWLDLDCQIVGSLSPLLSINLPSTKLAVRVSVGTFEMETLDKSLSMCVVSFNSGVCLVEKKSYLLEFWIFLTQQARSSFSVDDQLLAFAIHKCRIPAGRFALEYNWHPKWGSNAEAVILHWQGEVAKNTIWLMSLSEV